MWGRLTSPATPTRTWRSEAVARTSASAHLVCSEIRTMFTELTTRFPDVEITGPPSYLVSAPEQKIAVALRDLRRLAP